MKKTAISIILAAPLALAGCGDDPKPEPKTAADATQPATTSGTTDSTDTAGAADDDDDDTSNVSVDRRITDMCQLPEPNFGFDSASVSPGARATLEGIAKCFTDGPGKGKSINLVGHADKVGPDSYNRALGQRRAASVGQFLANAGLAQDRMATSSRGEMDATGPETGSATDRRVEILLADE